MFDPLLLRSFVAIVEEGGFTRAASRLHLTQSAVSGHLRRLEKEIGKQLLVRTTRSLKLTSDGEILIGFARAMIMLTQDTKAQLMRTPFEGTIRIGVSEDFAKPHVLRLLQGFVAKHPAAQIYMHVGIPGMLLPTLEQGNLDIVIGPQCEGRGGGRLLWREPLVWVSADQAAIRWPSPLPMVFFPEPCPIRSAALALLTKAGIAQRTAMICSSGASLRAAVLTGFAVTALPLSQLVPGMRIMREVLPRLPDVQYQLFIGTTVREPVVVELVDILVAGCSSGVAADLSSLA